MELTVATNKSKCWKLVLRVLLVILLVVLGVSEIGSEGGRRLSSRVVTLLKYGSLKGFIVSPAGRQMQPVEVFLGVPYASPPIGSLRFMPPLTPSPWRGIRVADHFGPVCPQKYPDISNETAAIRRMPKGRIQYLRRLIPYLRNQSEDCLYLNIYSPARVGRDLARLPVMVYVHGESFEWNSGNPYDGTILASFGDVVVVTLNFRLGVFGFLMVAGEAIRANFGLMDQIAALHWIKENIEEFGGDYSNVTIFGHGYGAACINFLMISPLAVGLFHRAILMSGSALSPWASVQDPIQYSRQVTTALGCKEDPEDKDSLTCLKKCSEQELLRVDVRAPDYLSAFGPIVDGIVIKDHPERLMTSDGVSFAKYDLLFGTAKVETLLPFNADDIQEGVDTERRDKILRTFLSNTRSFHLNELLALLVNEYTDWTKPVQHPIYTRAATMEILGDGLVVAPLVQTGNFHASFEVMPHATTYAYYFGYQSRGGDYYPHKMGSIHGEELSYVFGAPLIGGLGHFHRNYSKPERLLSETVITYWTNFAKSGDPNIPERQPSPEATTAVTTGRNKIRLSKTQWPPYDISHEKYITIGIRPKQRNHYRAHKLSIWLRLIPTLHRQDAANTLPAHHLLYRHDDHNLFTGTVRDTALFREGYATPVVPSTPPDTPWYQRGNSTQTRPHPSDGPNYVGTIRYPQYMPAPPTSESKPMPSDAGADTGSRNNSETLHAEAIAHGSYSTALSVTIAVGCSLLILNVLIFAGVYYQRDKNRLEAKLHKKNYHMKKVNEEAAAASAVPIGPTLPATPKKLPHSPQTTTTVNAFPTSGGQAGQVSYTPRAPPPSPVGQSSRTLLHRGEALPDLPNAIIVAQTLNATKAPPKVPPKPQSSTTPGGHDLNALTEVQPLLGQGLGTLGNSRQQHKSPKMQEIRV